MGVPEDMAFEAGKLWGELLLLLDEEPRRMKDIMEAYLEGMLRAKRSGGE